MRSVFVEGMLIEGDVLYVNQGKPDTERIFDLRQLAELKAKFQDGEQLTPDEHERLSYHHQMEDELREIEADKLKLFATFWSLSGEVEAVQRVPEGMDVESQEVWPLYCIVRAVNDRLLRFNPT